MAVEYGKRESAVRRQAWEDWVVRACGGSAAACKFVKGRTDLLGLEVAFAGTEPASSLPSARLEQHGEEWSAVWGCGAEVGQVPFACGEKLPPVLTAAQIRSAPEGFRSATSAADGLHPRHVALLSVPLLTALALFFWVCEAGTWWPEELADVIVRLLPKDSGGHRTVAVFHSLKPGMGQSPHAGGARLGEHLASR